jgi:hypothetical protein
MSKGVPEQWCEGPAVGPFSMVPDSMGLVSLESKMGDFKAWVVMVRPVDSDKNTQGCGA